MVSSEKMDILILGLSTRDIAQSAVRSGHNVFTLDYFGDSDQRAIVNNYSLMRDFKLDYSAENLIKCSRELDFDAVVYTSNLENYPELVEELAAGHTLLGNTPQTLKEVREVHILHSFCQDEGILFPHTFFGDEPLPTSGRWLRKHLYSGGGQGVSFWREGPLNDSYIMQEYVEGVNCSAAFVADGQKCVLIGITEQLIGKKEFGGRGFVWCGNILPVELRNQNSELILISIQDIASKLTRRFGLRGVNGFDFILTKAVNGTGVIYLIEVNPRYTGSMELIGWAYGLNVFNLHIQSFKGELPSFSLGEKLLNPLYYGKGVVYAKRNVVMPETGRWMDKGRRDIPFTGEIIQASHPICSVLVQGATKRKCWQNLISAAEGTYQEVNCA